MSRKKKRRTGNGAKRTVPIGSQKKSEPKRTVPIGPVQNDGYANAAAFLGEWSALFRSGTFLRSGLTSNTVELTNAYRENWLAMRIIDMPSEDMTRAWYTLKTEMGAEDLEDLRRLEARHSVKQEITNAIRWARLYGGALALMVIRGEERRLSLPLDPDALGPDCFQGLLVIDRAQGISPSLELVQDLDDPDFGLPAFYTVNLNTEDCTSVTIHHSRVLRFIGRELPATETVRENYWGASELEHIWDELQKRSETSQKQKILNMLSEENRMRTSYGLQLLSKDDSLENYSYNFAGLPEVYEAFMLDVAGAAEIPATKLFGRSPQGMNATGESDLRNYYEMIAGLQERLLRPALERLIPVMAISCWGFLPEQLDFVFNPLATETAGQTAELAERLSSTVIEAFKAGLITRDEAAAELKARGEKYAWWCGLMG